MRPTSHQPILTIQGTLPRPRTPLDLDDAKRITKDFIEYYNNTKLHSAIGLIAPKDRLAGRQHEIHHARDKKLEDARERRRIARQKLSLKTDHNQRLTTPAVA